MGSLLNEVLENVGLLQLSRGGALGEGKEADHRQEKSSTEAAAASMESGLALHTHATLGVGTKRLKAQSLTLCG